MEPDATRPLPPLVLIGFALAGTSPVALVAVTLSGATGLALRLLVPATTVALVFFLAPLAVWLGYSRSIAAQGGLFAFVERAAGRPLALVQGWVWTLSYVLYLPYTVTYIVYYLMPYVWPISVVQARVLEVALAAAICVLVLLAERAALYALAALSAVQAAALVALGAVVLSGPIHAHAPIVGLPAPSGLLAFAGGAAQVSLLFVCLSLVVFLGGEAAEGAAGVRRALGLGFALAAALTLIGAWTLAHGAGAAALRAWLPGDAVAARYASPAAATALGGIALCGIAAVIVAEFVALTRLGGAMLGLDRRTAGVVIAAFFVAADAASLVNPQRFYTVLIGPSVAALYLSQLMVFAVYPLLRRDGRAGGAGAWLVAAAAVAWSLFGLWGAVTTGIL